MSLAIEKQDKVVVSEFLATLQRQVPPFVQAIETALVNTYNLDVSAYVADHICWRTETEQEYSTLVEALKRSLDSTRLLVESEIGGRPIATFWLTQGIPVPTTTSITGTCTEHRVIQVLEIPAPKLGSAYKKGLEHVEFVIGTKPSQPLLYPSPHNNGDHQSAFEAFMNQYPMIPWDTKAKTKNINPDISLKLIIYLPEQGEQHCSVKFHLVPLDKVIEFEQKSAKTT
jgi:predicted metalloenzyme YecM